MFYLLKAIGFEKEVLKYTKLILLVFLTSPELTFQAVLEKTKVKLDLLTDADMLSMVKRDIRKYIMLFIYILKLIKNSWKIMIKINKWDINNLYG